ncbi:transglutaminase domain-containing protein [Actinomyces sp. 432]|uniref:transglutaminase domain-containing protein n=1 Tax=Actinomyces sp. 432 TaxID=2057798 RepID=UPI00137AFC29|nr:transglutaminase domain-containing protein [Actinomyces sp. 432]
MTRAAAADGQPTRRLVPWAAPSTTGWQVLVLGAALVLGGCLTGLSLMRDLGLLLTATAGAALVAGWLMALAARPRARLSGPGEVGEVHVGQDAVWQLAVATRLPRWVPLWVTWHVAGARLTVPVAQGGCAISYRPHRRGPLTVSAPALTCYDPLGLARARIPMRLDGSLLVLPRPLPPPAEAAATGTADTAGGVDAAAPSRSHPGTSGRQLGNLREYRPGDWLGSVHWRQSARTGRLIVIDREHEGRGLRRLRLDLRACAYTAHAEAPGGAAAAFEGAVSTATGLIEAWARAGHDVELHLGTERHRATAAHSTALLRRLATVEMSSLPEDDAADLPPGGPRPGTRAADAGPGAEADVFITGAPAEPQPPPGTLVLVADAQAGASAATDAAAASPPARAGLRAPQDAPTSRPRLRTARWQPLAAGLITVGLWHLAATVLAPLLTPAPWADRGLAVAAVALLLPALVRTARPQRAGLACALGLLAGSGVLWWGWRGTGQVESWLASPSTQLREVSSMLCDGIAPLDTGGALGFALCLFTWLLAWVCALSSAGGGDGCGATGLIPAAALLAPGIVLGQRPADDVVLAAGAGVLALILTAGPVPAAGTRNQHGWEAKPPHAAVRAAPLVAYGALMRALGKLAGVAVVTALAVGTAGVAVSLAPAVPVRAWSWNVSGAGVAGLSVPDTTLTLDQDLVRGSAATVFEYTSDVPTGTSLRFPLAVIRDLDGDAWEPLEDPGPASAGSLVAPVGGGALTAGGALVAAGVSAAEVRSGGADLPETHIGIQNLASARLPLAQSTALITTDANDDALAVSNWAWVPGTSTVVARGAGATRGNRYTVRGWNAVAGPDGTPQVLPPYEAAAADPQELAAYTVTPRGSAGIALTAREVVGAVGLDGTDAPPTAQAAALAAWFHSGDFVYDESAPGGFSGSGGTMPVDTVNDFLTDRHGYCVHYAAAFTLMARSLGLPTRIAIGYASRADGAATPVSGQELHAWPEVWFDDVGWVAFEPTPGGAGRRADTGADPQPSPTAAGTETPTASASAAPAPTVVATSNAPDPSGSSGAAGAGDATRPGVRAPQLAAAVLVALLLAGPALVRSGRRRRRLGRIRNGSRPAAAAWQELRDTATDLGLWTPPGRVGAAGGAGRRPGGAGRGPRARTHEALAEYLAALPGLEAAGRDLEELAGAAVAEAFGEGALAPAPGGRADGTVGDRERLASGLRTVTASLARATSLRRRLRARLLPASLWRRR